MHTALSAYSSCRWNAYFHRRRWHITQGYKPILTTNSCRYTVLYQAAGSAESVYMHSTQRAWVAQAMHLFTCRKYALFCNAPFAGKMQGGSCVFQTVLKSHDTTLPSAGHPLTSSWADRSEVSSPLRKSGQTPLSNLQLLTNPRHAATLQQGRHTRTSGRSSAASSSQRSCSAGAKSAAPRGPAAAPAAPP